MILSRRVSLGSVQLDQVDPSIVITGVNPGTTQESITAVSKMGGAGQRVTRQHWTTLDAVVSFAIDLPKRRLAERRAVFDSVKRWAMAKGWLETNQMSGKRMYADKVIIPDAGDMWDWTRPFDITFRAYNVPFWQDASVTPVTTNLTGDRPGSFVLSVNGDVQTVMDISFTNTSGSTIDTFEIIIGSNIMSLSDIALGNGKTLDISHGTDGLLQIVSDGVSVYDKQSATGAEDLYVEPGDNAIMAIAGGDGTLNAWAYGRYL